MNKTALYFLLITVLLGVVSCSTKKNKPLNKFYHNTTTRYNGYFNGRESFNSGVSVIEDGWKDDYTVMLPVFKYPDEDAAKSIYPQMNTAIEKCEKMINRHSMFIKKKEYNKWIDDCFLLMGKASFYKHDFPSAVKNLEYVAKAYKKEPIHWDAMVWLSHTLVEAEQYEKATQILDLLEHDADFPGELKGREKAIYALYYIKIKNFTLALPELRSAIAQTRNKQLRARWMYIMAQMYQHEDNPAMAVSYYSQVLKLRPPYELAFYCQINRAMAYNVGAGSSAEIIKELNKMLRDDKNKEFRDQIYFALAEIALKEGRETEGIELLNLSIRNSVSNNNQKGMAYYRLAELYFEKGAYQNAAAYYDSTASNISQNNENYGEIIALKNNLGRLVHDMYVVSFEDSVQDVASWDTEKRNDYIRDLIDDYNAEQERLQQESANNILFNMQNKNTANNNYGSGKNWIFYNPTLLSQGRSSFLMKWGDRKNEDNWRRKNKGLVAEENSMEDLWAEEVLPEDTIPGAKDPRNTLYYTKNLPLTPEKLDRSHNRIINALYDIGIVYKEKLKDMDQAIDAFNELIRRYDTCHFVPSAYYQMYRASLTEGYTDKANKYKGIILEKFPDSDYARLIKNPASLKSTNQKKELAESHYQESYRIYKSKGYDKCLLRCLAADSLFAKSTIAPKYALLKSLCIGKTQGVDSFKVALLYVAESFSETEEGKEARKYLGLLDKNPGKNTTKGVVYSIKPEAKHQFCLIVPMKNSSINDIKATVSNFNNQYFGRSNLKISSVLFSNSEQIVLVKDFSNQQASMDYYNAFVKNNTILKGINSAGYNAFAISQPNYPLLFKDKNISTYKTFFEKNYAVN